MASDHRRLMKRHADRPWAIQKKKLSPLPVEPRRKGKPKESPLCFASAAAASPPRVFVDFEAFSEPQTPVNAATTSFGRNSLPAITADGHLTEFVQPSNTRG